MNFKSFTIYRNLLVIKKDDLQRDSGLDVSQSDLIRNFILMDLLQRPKQDFEIIWNPMKKTQKTYKVKLISFRVHERLPHTSIKITNQNICYTSNAIQDSKAGNRLITRGKKDRETVQE
jgi:hypothetical protein